MASVAVTLFASVALLLIFVPEGYGIQCYVCNSHDRYEGKVCDDPFDENDIAAQRLLTNCSENHNTCMKMEQEVQGEKRIVRQCTEDAVIGMVERAGTKEVKLFYYGCDSQKCNGATSIYSHSILLFSIFAIFLSAIIKS